MYIFQPRLKGCCLTIHRRALRRGTPPPRFRFTQRNADASFLFAAKRGNEPAALSRLSLSFIYTYILYCCCVASICMSARFFLSLFKYFCSGKGPMAKNQDLRKIHKYPLSVKELKRSTGRGLSCTRRCPFCYACGRTFFSFMLSCVHG